MSGGWSVVSMEGQLKVRMNAGMIGRKGVSAEKRVEGWRNRGMDGGIDVLRDGTIKGVISDECRVGRMGGGREEGMDG